MASRKQIATPEITDADATPVDHLTGDEIWLHEYDMLKNETIERIKQRDGFINLNIVAIAAIVGLALSSAVNPIVILAIPWVSLCFGWAYLANDEKVSALGLYTRYHLTMVFGSEYLAWERSEKRSTNLKNIHKGVQLFADLIQFVMPGIASPIVFLVLTDNSSVGFILLAALEIVLSLGLCILFVLLSNFIERWNISMNDWTGIEDDPLSK